MHIYMVPSSLINQILINSRSILFYFIAKLTARVIIVAANDRASLIELEFRT